MSIALEEIVVRHTHRIPVPESPSVRGVAVRTLATVREMAGDHVRHNTCFRDFPRNVPDTFDFWAGLLRETLRDPVAARGAVASLKRGSLNLLALTGYGRYRHTYEEMPATG